MAASNNVNCQQFDLQPTHKTTITVAVKDKSFKDIACCLVFILFKYNSIWLSRSDALIPIIGALAIF